MKSKVVIEGYLYCIPYAGDRWVLTEEKHERGNISLFSGRGIGEVLSQFEGRKVRIVIEVVE